MTVMYPVQKQSEYTELMYSLRSLERYLPGDYEVIVVGDDMPNWITNVTQINLGDIRGRKQLTIKSKICAALNYVDEIFFMNDDVFLLQPTDPYSHPYYHYGDLKNYGEPGAKPLFDALRKMELPTKHFDLHYPLVYRRDMFLDAVKHFPQETIVKSMYCNYHQIEGEMKWDCKLIRAERNTTIREFIKIRPAFSTGVLSLNYAIPMLKELYPYKSKYEI